MSTVKVVNLKLYFWMKINLRKERLRWFHKKIALRTYNIIPKYAIEYASHCFVQDIKVALEISTSIWQKKYWPVLSWNFPKKLCPQLRTAQTFINCDLKDRLPQTGPTFLKSLSHFLFRTTFKSMLGQVIWPGFWILLLANEAF